MARIAHLTTVHHASDPRIFHKQLHTVAKAGFEAYLVAPNGGRDETRQGVRVAGLPSVQGRYRRAWLHPKLVRVARRLRAALYHIHDPELIPAAYLLKRLTGARVVYDMHEDFRAGRGLEGRLLRALERWCFRWVDHVVLSDAAYAHITDAAPAPATLVANYLQPPDPPVAQEERPAPPPLRLVYTGVLSEERGLAHLLDLAQALKREERGWRLDVAGVCYVEADRRRAERQYRRHGLQSVMERTAWTEHVPWRTLMQRAARAHVGLALMNPHPNFAQVVPTKFYEYLHSGLPLLCSDFPRWRRFVERHDCGAVVPPGDTQAALGVLRRWAADPGRYRALASNARAAAPRYRWPVMARRLVRLYNRLLGTNRPLPPPATPPATPPAGNA